MKKPYWFSQRFRLPQHLSPFNIKFFALRWPSPERIYDFRLSRNGVDERYLFQVFCCQGIFTLSLSLSVIQFAHISPPEDPCGSSPSPGRPSVLPLVCPLSYLLRHPAAPVGRAAEWGKMIVNRILFPLSSADQISLASLLKGDL